ncbi:uncharacterized protein DMAD_13180 [Drosophila madeirensis]|uniref:Uncharacterized protein n=1 Tax=Drosophila madeirensis TaxID=30013 RepID=A0AAU9FJZ4_DROMD
MSHDSIFELSHYSKFEILNQIKRNCESERPGAIVEIKYGDLIRFAACSQNLARMLFEWDTQLYSSLEQYMIYKITSIYIDFEEVYKRMVTTSSRDKDRDLLELPQPCHQESKSHKSRIALCTRIIPQ